MSTSMSPKATILVVDEEARVRKPLEKCFAVNGYNPLCVDTALAARELVANHPIDLVLVDSGLPHDDGLRLARDLHEFHQSIRVIMLSRQGASTQSSIREQTGAADAIAKPVDPRLVLKRVEHVLNRATH